MITMFDSIDANVIPANAQAVAGYAGGRWPTFAPLVKRFPNLARQQRIKSIAVTASEIAHVLDVETGDASPDQAPGWVRRMLAQPASVQIYKPVVYANAATMPAVLAALNAAGLKRSQYLLWVASYPGPGAVVPPGFDAHQFTNRGPQGQNYDVSVCNDNFFPPVPVVAKVLSAAQLAWNKVWNLGFNAGWRARH